MSASGDNARFLAYPRFASVRQKLLTRAFTPYLSIMCKDLYSPSLADAAPLISTCAGAATLMALLIGLLPGMFLGLILGAALVLLPGRDRSARRQ